MLRPALLSALVALLMTFACGDDDNGTNDAGSDAAADTTVICSADAHCSDGVFCNGQERCDPSEAGADSMGCVVVEESCLAGQTCDEDLDQCLTVCDISSDADGDGVDSIVCGGDDCDDCDDSDADRYPGNTEVCDAGNVDEDCDPTTLGGRDADGDGAIDTACCNMDNCGTDCDDGRAGTFPGSTEVCNGADNDCDGRVDEDVAFSTFFPDCDRDGFGDDIGGVLMMGCTAPSGAPASCAAGSWTTATGDCDDDDMSRNPGNPEVCNAIDDDCDTWSMTSTMAWSCANPVLQRRARTAAASRAQPPAPQIVWDLTRVAPRLLRCAITATTTAAATSTKRSRSRLSTETTASTVEG